MTSNLFILLRLVLWPNKWYTLENVPWALEKNVHSSVLHRICYICFLLRDGPLEFPSPFSLMSLHISWRTFFSPSCSVGLPVAYSLLNMYLFLLHSWRIFSLCKEFYSDNTFFFHHFVIFCLPFFIMKLAIILIVFLWNPICILFFGCWQDFFKLWFLAIDCDVLRCNFCACVYPVLDMLGFLDKWVDVFHQFFNQYHFKYFFWVWIIPGHIWVKLPFNYQIR